MSEELISEVIAGMRGQPGIGVGNAIGANVTMVALTLALAAVAPATAAGSVRCCSSDT